MPTNQSDNSIQCLVALQHQPNQTRIKERKRKIDAEDGEEDEDNNMTIT